MSVRPLIVGALVAEAVAMAAALTLVADFHAHRVTQDLGGVNQWGYRGPVMLQKIPDELRIAVAGGDLAFGWGVAAGETLAPNLRLQAAIVVDRPGSTAHRVTAVNLGARGLRASDYGSRLEHYQYLRPDVVCVVADPVEPAGGGSTLPRADSALWAAAGYAPMLPLVLIEKGQAMRSRSIEAAGRILETADRTIYRAFAGSPRDSRLNAADAIALATRTALDVARGVVIVLPPTNRKTEMPGHAALAATVSSMFHDNPRVRVVDLNEVPELADAGLRLDGVNFSAGGTRGLPCTWRPQCSTCCRTDNGSQRSRES